MALRKPTGCMSRQKNEFKSGDVFVQAAKGQPFLSSVNRISAAVMADIAIDYLMILYYNVKYCRTYIFYKTFE